MRHEPLYGHDIAFYLFDLPLLDRIQNTVAFLAFAAAAAILVIYVRAGLVAWRPGRGRGTTLGASPPPRQRRVIPFGLGIGIHPRPLRAADQSTGAVFGAGYTAVRITSWVLWVAAVLTRRLAVLAYTLGAAQWQRSSCWPAAPSRHILDPACAVYFGAALRRGAE